MTQLDISPAGSGKSSSSMSLPLDTKIYPVNRLFDIQKESLSDFENFWAKVASEELTWFKSWDKVLDWNPPFARWFVGGKINAAFNCVDRHVLTEKRNKVAYYWEGERGDKRSFTYQDLYGEVNKVANTLHALGVKRGTKVTIYLPMVPELPISMLACAKIGAPFTVVFSGFSSDALSARMNDSDSKLLITADGGFRRGKVIALKKIADDALEKSRGIRNTIVLKRTGEDVYMDQSRDIPWEEALSLGAEEKRQNGEILPEHLESNDPLYLLYSSGTTGQPKAIVHGTGGYMSYVSATTRWVFDPEPSDVYWCAADIGWVTGHSYIVFGPLSLGLTSLLYEGAIDYPENDRLWNMVERYGVNILYTSPTALRALMRYGDEPIAKNNLKSLKLLGTVGEPINPHVWLWYFNTIGGGRCPIVDTWWQTETGGILLSPSVKFGIVPLKPGSATFPLPGIDADVFDEEGRPAKAGERGYIVIKKPWPGMLLTLNGDEERYKQVYWSKFPGVYYPGDYCLKDNEGYFWLLGRADEVLKVAGHRLGTIEIEDALVSYEAVAESAVAGKKDEIKGESIVAFVILKSGFKPSQELAMKLKEHVREKIGPIATPSEVHFVRSLPKTRSGKIMRRVVSAVANGRENVGDLTTLEDEASVDDVKRALMEFQSQVF